MASSIPKEAKKEVVDGWVAEAVWKVALFTSGSNCLTQSLYSSCTNEVSGAAPGYTTGGATLSGRASGYVDTNNVYIDASDTSWTSATFTANYAVVYRTSDSKIRARYDFSGAQTVTAGTFTILWNSGGLVKIS